MFRKRFARTALLLLLLAVAPIAQAAEYPLDLLSSGRSDGLPGGEVVRIVMGVEGNDYGRLRVGIFEELSGGTSRDVRASVWMAAIVAGQTAGVDLFDHTIYFDFPGESDGPSAGAIKTAALLSVWLGHELSPDVVMTGTINPDGTVGPVGGIPNKIEAAAAVGKKLVLIPRGQERTRTGDDEYIDHFELGRSLGVEVRTVGNIYEAYPLLTGKPLPRLGDRAPVNGTSPSRADAATVDTTLPADVLEFVTDAVERWDGIVDGIVNSIARLGGTEEDMADILEARQAAADALDRGQPALALERITYAVYAADVLGHGYLMAEAMHEDGLTGAVAFALEQLDVVYTLTDVADRYNALSPKDFGQLQALMEAGAAVADAVGVWRIGYDMLIDDLSYFGLIDTYDPALTSLLDGRLPIPMSMVNTATLEALDGEEADYLMDAVLDAMIFFRLAERMSQRAFPEAGFYVSSPLPIEDDEDVDKLARQYVAGLSAVNEYLDSLILDVIAESMNMRVEALRRRMMHQHWDYAFDYGASQFLSRPRVLNPFLRLGAAGSTYHGIARLVVGYASLGAIYDPDGEIVAIEHEDALMEMLGAAEDEVVRSVQAVRRRGVEPIHSLMYLELARHYAQGTLDEATHALYLLWQADFLAKAVLRLAG